MQASLAWVGKDSKLVILPPERKGKMMTIRNLLSVCGLFIMCGVFTGYATNSFLPSYRVITPLDAKTIHVGDPTPQRCCRMGWLLSCENFFSMCMPTNLCKYPFPTTWDEACTSYSCEPDESRSCDSSNGIGAYFDGFRCYTTGSWSYFDCPDGMAICEYATTSRLIVMTPCDENGNGAATLCVDQPVVPCG